MKPKQTPEPTLEKLLDDYGMLGPDDDGISIPAMNHRAVNDAAATRLFGPLPSLGYQHPDG